MKNLQRGGWLTQRVNLDNWGHEVILQSSFDPDFPDSNLQLLIKHLPSKKAGKQLSL